jgi:hypothetical protein
MLRVPDTLRSRRHGCGSSSSTSTNPDARGEIIAALEPLRASDALAVHTMETGAAKAVK